MFGCSADGMADVRSGPDDGNDRTLESLGGRSIGAGSGMPGAAGAGFGVHTMAARAIGGCRPHCNGGKQSVSQSVITTLLPTEHMVHIYTLGLI